MKHRSYPLYIEAIMSRDETPESDKVLYEDITRNLEALHILAQKQKTADLQTNDLEKRIQQLKNEIVK